MKCVFLDRDGTIIEDVGFIRDPDDVRMTEGSADALRRLMNTGFGLVMVTNQSGIGRGIITRNDYEKVQTRVRQTLKVAGIRLLAEYHCPHLPTEGCSCRKPKPGMLLEAAADHGINLDRSFAVGDRWSDVLAGQNAGCRASFLVSSESTRIRLCDSFQTLAWETIACRILG